MSLIWLYKFAHLKFVLLLVIRTVEQLLGQCQFATVQMDVLDGSLFEKGNRFVQCHLATVILLEYSEEMTVQLAWEYGDADEGLHLILRCFFYEIR